MPEAIPREEAHMDRAHSTYKLVSIQLDHGDRDEASCHHDQDAVDDVKVHSIRSTYFHRRRSIPMIIRIKPAPMM